MGGGVDNQLQIGPTAFCTSHNIQGNLLSFAVHLHKHNSNTRQLKIVCIESTRARQSRGDYIFFQLSVHKRPDEKRKTQVKQAAKTEQNDVHVTCDVHLCARLRSATDDREGLKATERALPMLANFSKILLIRYR